MTALRREKLDNGVVVEFIDRSNRYFGNYYRVCVEVRLTVPRPESADPLVKAKMLERMGVAGEDLDTVRTRLMEDFWRHAGHYLAHAGYPARLLAAEAAACRRAPLSRSGNNVP